MCTVSVVRPSSRAADAAAVRWRVVCSRDEQRDRPVALPPVVGTIGRHRVASPIDPSGPGTWIAATSAGLAFALLNAPGAVPGDGRTSRGRVIPLLAGAVTLQDAASRAGRLVPLGTRPFVLLVIGDAGVLEVVSDGDRVASTMLGMQARFLRTSSSRATEVVSRWRQDRFDEYVVHPETIAQDRFHACTDPVRPERGVIMARPDACTVSVSSITRHGGHLEFAYRSLAGGSVARTLRLGVQPGSGSTIVARE